MRIPVLGGTRFLGRTVVDVALGCGDFVTLFNRGQTNPGLYPGAENVSGDRVLASGDPADLVQFIDVRDLAGWFAGACHAGRDGVFDLTGSPLPSGTFRVAAFRSGSGAAGGH